MYLLDENKVTDGIASQSWCERGSKAFKLLKLFSKLDVRYIINNVKQSNASAGIVNRLRGVFS